jgi:hypothetical protein
MSTMSTKKHGLFKMKEQKKRESELNKHSKKSFNCQLRIMFFDCSID